MNRAKKFKIHKKTKVKKLQDEVKRLKNDLWMAKFDRDSIIDSLRTKLRAAEQMAVKARPPVKWEREGALDPYVAVCTGRAKHFMASQYLDTREVFLHSKTVATEEWDNYTRETLERKIAKAIHDQVPVYTQKDERTGIVRYMVDFWLLFADKPREH